MRVIKRNEEEVKFDFNKIKNAVTSAYSELNKKVSENVLGEIKTEIENYTNLKIDKTIHVEDIQDIIERVLVKYDLKVAKEFITYREKHRNAREWKKLQSDLIDTYVDQDDWRVKENSNMGYSLQGLNCHISNEVTKAYWLDKIYPKHIANAHKEADIHIHDLGLLASYCVGWSLEDLLLKGFTGVEGKISSAPAKHFSTALGQIVNFLFTMSGEVAGAVAFSSVDTLLAPFIYYDNLTYSEVKQMVQSFVFNLNVPTRTGFQCLSEDTEILTSDGWKTHKEIEKNTIIATLDMESKNIEYLPVLNKFEREYNGKMYNLKNRITDQLISPQHRIVRQIFNTDKYILEPVEETLKYKSDIQIPVAGNGLVKNDSKMTEWIKLVAWIISDGYCATGGTDEEGQKNIVIYLNPYTKNLNKHRLLLLKLGIEYLEIFSNPTIKFIIPSQDTESILKIFDKKSLKKIPEWVLNLNKNESRIFLEAFTKNYKNDEVVSQCKIFIDDVSHICVNAGYSFNITQKECKDSKTYTLTIIKEKTTTITEIETIDYSGVIWCPTTKNETVIARRNGKVFVTGNCPFSNITLDWETNSVYKDSPVIIGGELKSKTYKDFKREQDIFNKALLETYLEGDSLGRVFTFPIPTYNIVNGFNWNSDNAILLKQLTAKYGIPYFSNFVNSSLSPDDVRSMCCRLRIDNTQLQSRGGGLFGANPLTGSIGVVTINLAKLGFCSNGDTAVFYNELERILDTVKESLIIKRKVIERLTEQNLFPYSKFYLQGVKDKTGSYWGNHFSTIGIIGANEMVKNFMNENIGNAEAREFVIDVMKFINNKLLDYQKETGHLFNLEATPAESTSYRLALIDRNNYPMIEVANDLGEPYYTNSTQLPADYTDDIFEMLEHQDELQQLYTGGTVVHLFTGEKLDETSSIDNLITNICENFKLPYFSITPTYSICPKCGYLAGEIPVCECGSETEVYSRVVGYLRPVKQWNKGKQDEFKNRSSFKYDF